MKLLFETTSAGESEALGRKIGKSLKGGEVIELVSDVGGGKTTITKGIVNAMGSEDMVHSPTFTVSNVYSAPELTIHHYDFYRLGEIGLMGEELQEVLDDNNNVVLVEWAGSAHDLFPVERLTRIELRRKSSGEDDRDIIISSDATWMKNLGGREC